MITDPSLDLLASVGAIVDIMNGNLSLRLSEAKELLKNKDIPLEVRWASYRTLVKVNAIHEIDSCGDGFVDYLVKADGSCEESTMYDDFHTDRHETMYYIDMYDMMGPAYHTVPKYTTESIDDWRELVLATGDAGFEYDW